MAIIADNPIRHSLSGQRRRSSTGFSLIELIVVIAIIATMTGIIVPRLRIGAAVDPVRDEARRLGELLRRASDDAVFKTRELGVFFSEGDYRFFRLDGDGREGKWVELSDDKTFTLREIAENVEIELQVSGVSVVLEAADSVKIDEKTRPHVMLLSNGEIMPDFSVVFEQGTLEDRWEVATGVEVPVTVSALDDNP